MGFSADVFNELLNKTWSNLFHVVVGLQLKLNVHAIEHGVEESLYS